MALFSIREGSLEIPDYVVAAVTCHAERMADRVAEFLQFVGISQVDKGDGRSCGLSADTLLDLGALLLLATWDRSGVNRFLPADTPSFDDASRAFQQRLDDAAVGKFEKNDHLHQEVFKAWLTSVAWEGPVELQADFAVGEIDEDALVDAIAELIWPHRHDQAIDVEHASQVVNP
jgi:hypothetical protein